MPASPDYFDDFTAEVGFRCHFMIAQNGADWRIITMSLIFRARRWARISAISHARYASSYL